MECQNCEKTFYDAEIIDGEIRCPFCYSSDVIKEEKMSREYADITIQFDDLEDVDFELIEEFLQDQKIKYEVIDAKNWRTKGDDTEKDVMDIIKEIKERGDE